MQTRLNQTNGHQQHVSIQPGDSYHDSVLCPLPHLTSSVASCKHLVQKKKRIRKKITTPDRQSVLDHLFMHHKASYQFEWDQTPSQSGGWWTAGATWHSEESHRYCEQVVCFHERKKKSPCCVFNILRERKLLQSCRMSFSLDWINHNPVFFFIYFDNGLVL